MVFAAIVSTACEDSPLLAPTGADLTLVANSASIPADGSLDITAIVAQGQFGGDGGITDGGGPPVKDNTQVNFATTLGRLEPAIAKTTDGKATVKLVGEGRAGTARVTAFSGAAFSTIDITLAATGTPLTSRR